MEKFEKARTKVSARLITMAVLSCTVTANALHMPKICPETGLLSQIGVKNTRKALVRVIFIICLCPSKVFQCCYFLVSESFRKHFILDKGLC